MRSYGFLGEPSGETVADVLHAKGDALPALVHTHPAETVRDAIDTLRRYGVSQVPVVSAEPPVTAGEVLGSVSDRELLERVVVGRAQPGDRVAQHMAPPLPLIGAGESLRAAREALRGADALLVVRDGEPIGVLTRHDLLGHLSR
jgi:cystathionine beta-synthase